jgi:integrase/recombinase XerD
VVRLTLADADFTHDLLFIRETKVCKSRIVPLGPNLAQRLKRYVEERCRFSLLNRLTKTQVIDCITFVPSNN